MTIVWVPKGRGSSTRRRKHAARVNLQLDAIEQEAEEEDNRKLAQRKLEVEAREQEAEEATRQVAQLKLEVQAVTQELDPQRISRALAFLASSKA